MTSGYQTAVAYQPSPAVAGDWASSNPRAFIAPGPFGLVAGPNGLTVGRFAWTSYQGIDADNAPTYVNNNGGGPVAGIVHREQQGLITQFLSDASMTIPAGYEVSICTQGDLWVKNDGSTQALVGQKAYASLSTGQVSFAATGSPSTTTQTSATITAGTGATFTGSISGNVLTISSAVTNTLYLGALLSGGSGMAAGTHIVALLSGTFGQSGSTYALDTPEQTVASATLTATPYLAAGTGGSGIALGSTITATATGTVTGTVVGGIVTAIITAGTDVVVMLPGAGTGTFTTGTITFAQNVETKWIAQSSGLAGELVKISSWPQG